MPVVGVLLLVVVVRGRAARRRRVRAVARQNKRRVRLAGRSARAARVHRVRVWRWRELVLVRLGRRRLSGVALPGALLEGVWAGAVPPFHPRGVVVTRSCDFELGHWWLEQTCSSERARVGSATRRKR